jgi:hypothetical protein
MYTGIWFQASRAKGHYGFKEDTKDKYGQPLGQAKSERRNASKTKIVNRLQTSGLPSTTISDES